MKYRIGFILSSVLFFVFCSNPKEKRGERTTVNAVVEDVSTSCVPQSGISKKVSELIFFMENSGSMFGYVSSGGTDFIKVVSGLVSNSNFSSLKKQFFLINAKTTNLGGNKDKFNSALSLKGMNQGDPRHSDLNNMIDEVMSNANDSTISVLISDGIYSLLHTSKEQIENNLILKSDDTKAAIFKRLTETDLSVIVVKLSSYFKGKYYPVIGSSVNISKQRPYYIWIFGPTQSISSFFPAEYFESLPGYNNMSHFVYVGEQMHGDYQVVAENSKGKFKFSRKSKNQLEFIEKDRQGDFQFSIAVDFSNYPFPQKFFIDSSNYEITPNYEIQSIKSVDNSKLPVWVTHLITIKAKGNPLGKMQLKLLSKVDRWITESSTTDDTLVDEYSTFGLEYLMGGISNAFQDKQNSKYLTVMDVDVVLN